MLDVQSINEADINKYINQPNVNTVLEKTIIQKLDKAGIYYRIFSRVKSPSSIASKLIRKNDKYIKESKKMQDIVGVRVVVYYHDDIQICKEILSEEFNEHPADSAEDVPEAETFKPVRKNYIFELPDNLSEYFDKRLWENYRIDKTFELQLRTIFSEGWYEVEHDVRYKHEAEWKETDYYAHNRALNSIIATLELCDGKLVSEVEDVAYDCYKANKIKEMLRYKFRIRLKNEDIPDELLKIMNSEEGFVKELYRADRNKILCALAHEKMTALPLTLPNIIFLSNEMSIHNKEIEKAAPPLLLTNIKKSIEIIERI